jgi:hypothetical protein
MKTKKIHLWWGRRSGYLLAVQKGVGHIYLIILGGNVERLVDQGIPALASIQKDVGHHLVCRGKIKLRS